MLGLLLVADPLDLSNGSGGGGGPSIVTTALADGTVGVPYSQTLVASGGTPAYTWSVVAGALPAWATLNPSTGAITGTPGATGTASFTVRVTDAGSLTADRPLTITVFAAPTASTGTRRRRRIGGILTCR